MATAILHVLGYPPVKIQTDVEGASYHVAWFCYECGEVYARRIADARTTWNYWGGYCPKHPHTNQLERFRTFNEGREYFDIDPNILALEFLYNMQRFQPL